MNCKFLTVIGVTYVAIIAVVAAFCVSAAINDVDASERKAGQVAEQAQRVNQSAWRLSGPQRLPTTPEYIDGKPVKYRIGKDGNGKDGNEGVVETPKKQEVAITASNYLAIWTADWCPYCPKMKAIGARLEAEGFCVVYFNLDDNREEAKRLGIRSIPTAIIYDTKLEVLRITGVNKQSESQIRGVLRKDSDVPDNHDLY